MSDGSVSFEELSGGKGSNKKKGSKMEFFTSDDATETASCKTDFKTKAVLFILFIVVCSSMFIHNVVDHTGENMLYDSRSTTNKGTIVQSILLVLMFSVFESLHASNIL